MKKIFLPIAFLFFISCDNKPTLQKYFVENSEKQEFISVDLASSFINTDKIKLSKEEKTALESFEKMNILVLPTDSLQIKKYETEAVKIKTILKDEMYQELIKFNKGNQGAAVYLIEENEKIDEFVFFASSKDTGLALVRVLGNDMNPDNIINMFSIIQKADLNLEQLKPLQHLVK